jgi:hypothetical protein
VASCGGGSDLDRFDPALCDASEINYRMSRVRVALNSLSPSSTFTSARMDMDQASLDASRLDFAFLNCGCGPSVRSDQLAIYQNTLGAALTRNVERFFEQHSLAVQAFNRLSTQLGLGACRGLR